MSTLCTVKKEKKKNTTQIKKMFYISIYSK